MCVISIAERNSIEEANGRLVEITAHPREESQVFPETIETSYSTPWLLVALDTLNTYTHIHIWLLYCYP